MFLEHKALYLPSGPIPETYIDWTGKPVCQGSVESLLLLRGRGACGGLRDDHPNKKSTSWPAHTVTAGLFAIRDAVEITRRYCCFMNTWTVGSGGEIAAGRRNCFSLLDAPVCLRSWIPPSFSIESRVYGNQARRSFKALQFYYCFSRWVFGCDIIKHNPAC